MFEDIVSFENMYRALKDSCKGVRWKDSVVRYETNGVANTISLMNELKSGKYRIEKYRFMQIHDPKDRTICCVSIRDRQVQHCICDNYLYDALTRTFIYDNFACQKDKGNHKFIKRLTQHLCKYYRETGSNHGYALTCDIKSFFNSIPHDVAKNAISKRANCKEVIELVNQIVDGFDGDVGLFAGGQVVQLIALAVLDDMDHYIKEQLHIKHYMRYNDDFVLIHEDREYLNYCKTRIENLLLDIGLTLNPRKTIISRLDKGFKILHWRFVMKDNGKVLRIPEKSKVLKQKRKIKKLIDKERSGEIGPNVVDDSMVNWMNYMKQGNTTYHTRVNMDKYVKSIKEGCL